MERILERCCALDVHKRQVTACVHVPKREANRLQKLLEDANIKLGDVASDVLGASGKAMLRALCEGNADPVALAELAQGKLRRKIPALRAALEGHFSANHALLVSHLLSH